VLTGFKWITIELSSDSWKHGNDHFGFQTPRDSPRYFREYLYKKDPLIQIVGTQHITNSAMLQTAVSLKRELQRGTIEIKISPEREDRKMMLRKEVS
jgi:hypothetical protein